MVSVSIVVPVYSGSKYLRELTQAISDLRERWMSAGGEIALAELVFVDDAAIDESPAILDEIGGEFNWVSVLHLAKNFGQHAATVAGILHTSGDWVVTLDEDLQHPPEKIMPMLEAAARSHSDVVYARPSGNVHQKWTRDTTSRVAKRVLELLSGNPRIRDVSSFRLIRGSIARSASAVCAHDTYFDVALGWFSNRIEVVRMELTDVRFVATGASGYSLRSLLSHLRKLLITSHLKILRVGALFGILIAGFSGLAGLILIAIKLFAPALIVLQGWTSLILVSGLFGGLTLVFLGLILEYLSLLVLRANGRPLFFAIDRSTDKLLLASLNKQN